MTPHACPMLRPELLLAMPPKPGDEAMLIDLASSGEQGYPTHASTSTTARRDTIEDAAPPMQDAANPCFQAEIEGTSGRAPHYAVHESLEIHT